jgi:hypothetical protein
MSTGSIDPKWFPNLTPTNHVQTSEKDANYNCVAWAAGHQDKHWWPDPDGMGNWPIANRDETVACFVDAYIAIGYESCPNDDPAHDPEYEKVAIFAQGAEPTHAARQKSNGKWTSKMGTDGIDIEHDWGAVDGPSYGRPVRVLRRKISQVMPGSSQTTPVG